jgi:hypothetical protein
MLLSVGAGQPSLLVLLLLGVAGVVMWSREHPPQNAMAVPLDLPARLMRWGNGLLPADRTQWGQAMLGELDRIEGRSRRWRFALGCVGSVVVLPPWGSLIPMAALAAAVLGSATVIGVGFVHFGLASNQFPWNWVLLAVLAALMMGSLLAVSVQLRRPLVAPLGMTGGIFIAGAWVVCTKFTYEGFISPINSVGAWSGPTLFLGVPLVVGTVGAWRSGSASVGRRAARLAGVSAGLAVYFVSNIAVLAIDGGPRDPGVGIAGGVSEAFGNVAILFLISLPLATTTVGWVAATATARLRPVALVPSGQGSASSPTVAGQGAVRGKRRMTKSQLLCAATAVVVLVAVVLFVQAR